MNADQVYINGHRANLLTINPLTTAIGSTVTTPLTGLTGMQYLVVEANLVYGAGGTTVDAYIQTSLDGGLTWFDIMNFHFTTSGAAKVSKVATNTAVTPNTSVTDGTMSANTVLDGVLGDRLRLKYATTGTYTTNTVFTVDAVIKG